MMQKVIVGLLVLTVLGAAAVGVYDATRNNSEPITSALLADSATVTNAAEPVADASVTADTTSDAAAAPIQQQDLTATPGPVLQQQSQDTVGDPWTGSGTINVLDANGMSLTLADGSTIIVELGPSQYWEAQPVTLAVGDVVTVNGFYNGLQYHAATITKADGSQLAVRTEIGQPLWAGGNGQSDTQEQQVVAEDWVTVDGTVTAINNSVMTVQTTTGDVLDMQLGSPSFMQSQTVTFAPGDEISVLGVWQGTQFRAGDITKLATGERLMLLDPNGRPLWGGPGRNGNGGQGQSGQTQSSQGNSGQGNGGQGNSGQGNGGQGNGGQGQNRQTVLVPAAQWETAQGSVTLTEPLALTLQITTGETVRVALGEVDFWTEQGIWFSIGDTLDIEGYWLNGQFEAGTVTFTTSGQQLDIRDQSGRLLWMDTASTQGGGRGQGQGNQSSQTGQGNGNGYRGGRQS